jgi:hypothetical protein
MPEPEEESEAEAVPLDELDAGTTSMPPLVGVAEGALVLEVVATVVDELVSVNEEVAPGS